MSFWQWLLGRRSGKPAEHTRARASDSCSEAVVSPSDDASKDSSREDTIEIDRVTFKLVQDVDAFCATVDTDGRAALRFALSDYGNILQDTSRTLEDRYGNTSQEAQDILSSLLLCAQCRDQFSGLYKLSLQTSGRAFRMTIGATPGSNDFGKAARCPNCACDAGLLVYERFRGDAVTEADLEAIRAYWRARGHAWWERGGGADAMCDFCGKKLERGQGLLYGSDLCCEPCIDEFLTDGVSKLQKDPHFFGDGLLRSARALRDRSE